MKKVGTQGLYAISDKSHLDFTGMTTWKLSKFPGDLGTKAIDIAYLSGWESAVLLNDGTAYGMGNIGARYGTNAVSKTPQKIALPSETIGHIISMFFSDKLYFLSDTGKIYVCDSQIYEMENDVGISSFYPEYGKLEPFSSLSARQWHDYWLFWRW